MKKKPLLATLLVLGSLALLAGCGGVKETTPSNDVATTEETNVDDVTADDNKRDLTQDECFELVAYAFKAAQYQAQGDQPNLIKWAQKTADLQAKYEMDDAEYEEACGVLMTEPTFMQRVQKRMAELK